MALAPVAKYLGSQPTYEELKHVLYLQLRLLLIGSQPTYEELKPLWRPSQDNSLRVPSLPMRN